MQIILASAKIMNDRLKSIPDISLSLPRFHKEAEDFARDMAQYNYCFIRELNRFYFIDDVVIENNGIRNYKLSIDVLMTYKNEIMNNKTHIIESENVINADNIEYSEKNNEVVSTFNFPDNPFEDNKTDVLICVRG